MFAFIARRMLLAGLSTVVISLMSFTIIQLPPGDRIDRMLATLEGECGMGFQYECEKSHIQGGDVGRNEANHLRELLGYDQPMYIRYLKWVRQMAEGDFGIGMMRAGTQMAPGMRAVTEIVGDRIWLTIWLTSGTAIFIFLLAFPIGIYSAVRQYSFGDYAASTIGFIGLSIPDFLLALVLAFVMFEYFEKSAGGLFSGDMRYQPWSPAKIWDLLQHIWIPVTVLGTAGTASTIRVLRNNLLDEMKRPYVLSAHARGLAGWKVILKYPVRVAMNPVISNIGSVLPSLIGGSIIISVILDLPTVGPQLLEAIDTQDVYVGGFIVLMMGILGVIGILVSDLLLVLMDPRIRMWDD